MVRLKYIFILVFTVLIFGFSSTRSMGQDSPVRPQIWSNLFTAWNIDDKWVLRGGVAYNILLSSEAPWSEFTFSTSGIYKFHRFMEGGAGLYLASANQSTTLRSNEYRPYGSFRIYTNTSKRWYVTNLSRLEFRFFRYSDRTKDQALRIRNRTYGVISLLRPKMTDDNNLFLFAYFEAFFNFGEDVRERFFNQFKYKIGLGYRLSYAWRFNLGMIYQDASDNVVEPSQLPVTIDTRWIMEWGIGYIIPPGKKK